MDGRHAAVMIVTIHAWRNNDHFDDVWKAAHSLKDVHGCAEPALPRPCKIPGHLDDHEFTAHHSILPLDHYRTVCFHILDEAGEGIRNRIIGKRPEILALAEEIVVGGIQGKLQESSTKSDTPRHNFCDDINVTTFA